MYGTCNFKEVLEYFNAGGERGELGHNFKYADFLLISFYKRDDYIFFWACRKVHMVGYINSHKLGVAPFSIFCS